jgi:hypothetical protein
MHPFRLAKLVAGVVLVAVATFAAQRVFAPERRSPPIRGHSAAARKSRLTWDCVVGPGDVPLVCDFKELRCPTALKAKAERKRQFGLLSNLSRS